MLKGKSLIVAIFTFVIQAIGAYSGLFSPSVSAWLGVVSFLLTILLNSQFFATGEWPLGWSNVLWITNVAGVLIQVLNYMGDHMLIEPQIVNYIIVGVNTFMLAFIKNYGGSTSVIGTR